MQTLMKVRFIVLLTLCIACLYSCKKDPNKKLLKDYTHKIAGSYYWHGVFHTTVYKTDTPYIEHDSFAAIKDTFEIKVINSESISIRGLVLGLSEINSSSGIITYSRLDASPFPRQDFIYYHYKESKIKYLFIDSGMFNMNYKELYTP
jgi:hypothetical protein